MLWECYEALRNVMKALRKLYGVLRSVTEVYGALHDVTGRHGTLRIVTERYGTATELLRNVTEPLRKILILPITNRILNFAHHQNVSMRALRYTVLSDFLLP